MGTVSRYDSVMLRVSHAPWVTEGPRDHRLGAGGGPRRGRGCSDGLPLAHGCGGKGGVHAQRAQRHLSALPCCAPRAGVLRASLSLPRPSAPRTWPPPGRSLLTLPPRPGVPLCEVSPGPKSARSPHAAPLRRARPAHPFGAAPAALMRAWQRGHLRADHPPARLGFR